MPSARGWPAGPLTALGLPLHELLIAVRVAQHSCREGTDDLTEAEIGVGEARSVTKGAQEDRTDGDAPPGDRNDRDGLGSPLLHEVVHVLHFRVGLPQ